MLHIGVGGKKKIKKNIKDLQPNRVVLKWQFLFLQPSTFKKFLSVTKASVITTLTLKWSFHMWLFYVSYILGWLLPGIF